MSGKSGRHPLGDKIDGIEAAAGAQPFDVGHDAPERRGECLTLRDRLRKRADYLRCYRTGRRRNGALVILYVAANELGHARMGITATRKVGHAVLRHRLKRWVREAYRRWPERGRLPALDIVVHLKPEAGAANHSGVAGDLSRLLGDLARRGGSAGRRDRRDTPA
jgi:ribonuclease P protein component